ncbi:hypothetical protein [Streptomyces sp. NPDC001536]|uniref:hypothetical protein n=1 Tax=Streptomyces sp. NPDC001536 TaxID=3364583 RepID=UPI00367D5A5C
MGTRLWDGVAAAVRLAEGDPLREAFDTGDPAAWTALDAGVRTASWDTERYVWLTPAWEKTEGGRAVKDALLHGRPLTEGQLALALCHREGKVRAAALSRAVDFPRLLPLLVVRCSDWAAPVREVARRRLTETLDAEGAVRVMPVILRVGRRDRGDFVTGLATELLRAAPPETLAPLYADPHRRVRRYAYRLAVGEAFLSPGELARAAARDGDTVVQSLCADSALAAVSDEDGAYDDVLEPLLAARGPQARAAGVTALRRAGRSERAVGFLGDRSGVVRACARYVVRQGGGDPSVWYRERCGRPEGPAPGVVIGLAECGERADAEVLWPLVGHPAAGVRARAVAGLRLLDVVDVRRLLPLLDDPAPGVVREVTAALLPSAGSLDTGRLMERLARERPRHVRVAAFRLLHARDGLVRLRASVALVDDPDDKLRRWAGQSVQRWHPTADVRHGTVEVGELLDRGRHLFSEHVLKRRKWEAGLKA